MRHTTVTEPAPVVVPQADLVPLSVLSLDHPPPAEGWPAFLGRRGIVFLPDDLGRDCIRRSDAARLMGEKREAEIRAARLREVAELELVEADQLRRAQIWKGVSADALPVGVSASSAMLQAARDSRPHRRTPLEEALSNSGTLTYHPLPSTPDGDES